MSPVSPINPPDLLVEPVINFPVLSSENCFAPLIKNNQNRLSIQQISNPQRLQEIYDLRLSVWEDSGKSIIANSKLFPNGWADELDESAFHWGAFNDQNEIVASARLNIFETIEDFPYHSNTQHLALPSVMPFAFYSRLGVHPLYRQNGLSRKLLNARANFCKEKEVKWSNVFINNPHIIRLFETEGYSNTGQAQVSYHASCKPHSVHVLVKKEIFFE